MDDVIQQAQKLAELIANHALTKAFREAAAAVEADPAASKIQEAYARAVDAVQRAEMEGRPIEPDQKRAMKAAAEDVRKSPMILRLLEAHQGYMEMMEAVQQVLSGGPDEHDHEHGPGCDHDHGHDHGHEHGPGPTPGVSPADTAPPGKPGGILWTP